MSTRQADAHHAFVVGFLAALLLPADAEARPDDGAGLFTFDAADVVEFWDVPDARVRVHFSSDGPNATVPADSDGDGVPDFVATVGLEVAEVLAFYEAMGFRVPLFEADIGLAPLGGSADLDVYLVDFGGSSDGQFGVDGCLRGVCAGHLLIENDFSGYGYPSLDHAAQVLASHELFHGVQYAYAQDLDPWFSEGTAVWAEHLYEPEVEDYLRFCTAYLGDVGRSIDRPPAGSVTAFSYGTALYFGFLQEQLGADVMVDMLDRLGAAGDGDEVGAMADAVDAAGGDFADLWLTFATWNLATGPRSGRTETYPYAVDLWPGISAEVTGSSIVDDNRFYPLAATYFRLDHTGGELFIGVGEDNDEAVIFQVHPADDSGKVLDPILTWRPDTADVQSLGPHDAGTFWLLGTYPQVASESEKRLFCFGDAATMDDCALAEVDTSGDTGIPDDTGPTDDEPEVDGGSEDDTSSSDKGGCSTLALGVSTWTLWLPVWAVSRRRET